MINIERIKKGWRNPLLTLEYFQNQLLGRIQLRLNSQYCKPNQNYILDEEWDVLIILDACRLGSLKEENPFESPCSTYRSQASNTGPWFQKNFATVPDEKTSDVIYISANPKASSERCNPAKFYHLEEVFDSYWDKEERSVPPEAVTSEALKHHSQNPDCRLVVHYIQPHGPFIGTENPTLSKDRYEKLRSGDVTLEKTLDTYRECLRYVLQEVKHIVEYTDGKIVITSDHGESLGESGIYAHPPWAHSEVLLNVPWVEMTGKGKDPDEKLLTRKKEVNIDESVEDMLVHLGYK